MNKLFAVLASVCALGFTVKTQAEVVHAPEYPEPAVSWVKNPPPAVPAAGTPIKLNPPFNGFAKTKIEEKFTRGVEAIPTKDTGVYVIWRLLKEDAKDIKFDVFRIRDGKEQKLNTAPIEQTCDFVDSEGKQGDLYAVRPSAGYKGLSGEASSARWCLDENIPYLRIKLDDPKASVQKIGIGDLNNDGIYDFVVKTPSSNVDPMDIYWKPSKETFKLSAYLSDGTHLWTKDLGWNIETGMWYSPFIVFDFNGDGKAEVAVKMTDDKDHRDKDGRVYSGPEYLAILDGMTGKVMDKVPWPSREGFENYNLVSRNQMSVAYLDGKTPCIIALRGTYGTMKAEAWQLKGKKLESCWKFRNDEGRYNEANKEDCQKEKTASSPKYYGQGAHDSLAADIDNDGRDELILGSFALNGNGDILWALAKGHPDWMILTDIIWENPGMEIAYLYESAQSTGGVCVVDAKTGKIIWKYPPPSKHVHTGHCANFDPTLSGPEVLGIDHNFHNPIDGCYWRFTNKGKLLSSQKQESGVACKGVYWDADLEKEIFSASSIRDYNGGAIGSAKGNIGWAPFVVDLMGDWREEIITSLPGELRIYSTTIPAMDRRITLLQEHQYRTKVAINSQGYHHDPNLPYLPTFESNNFSMIFKPSATNPTCQVTVSASMHGPVDGTVSLKAPAGISIIPNTWKVNLKAGEIAVKNVRIKGKYPEKTWIQGELKISDSSTALRGQVPIYETQPKMKAPSGNAIKWPAAKFSENIGGNVKIITGRPGAPDGCMVAWDIIGHKISWKINVPKTGNYNLVAQYAAVGDAERSLTVNGNPICKTIFNSTGGKGEKLDEWNWMTFSQKGKPLILQLHAGENLIEMENTDNSMLNFAYLYLILN